MSIFKKDFDFLEWGLRIAFLLFILCVVIPAFLNHASEVLKDVPIKTLTLLGAAFVGGIAGAAFQDGMNRIKAKREDKSIEE